MDGTVLVADDDRTIRTVLTQALTRAGCKVHATGSLQTLMRWVAEGKGDAVISDVMMPDGNGLETLPDILTLRPGLPVIVISAQNTIMTAVQAEEAQAWDYLPKPFDLPDLLHRTARALDRRVQTGDGAAPAPTTADSPLIGRSPAMQALYRLMAKVVNTELPILVTGESGAGKSLVAQVLHELSERREGRFIAVKGEDLSSAEAAEDVVRRAGRGTLCLDDVGDFSSDAQMRAAHLIDGLGARGPALIATAQGDAAGLGLRDDLFYRLNGVVIPVPPLRDRPEDIALHAAQILGDGPQLGQGALAALQAYGWPGNVRQLTHVLHRLALTAHGDMISTAEVATALAGQPRPEGGALREGEGLSQSIARHLRHYFDMHGADLPAPGLYGRILREMEHPLIGIALEATGGNQAKCADMLGINRNTLRKKISDLEIEVTRRRKMM